MTLFVLCGQVLASPFLACMPEIAVDAGMSMEEHCARMLMMSSDDSPGMDMTQQETPATIAVTSNHAGNITDGLNCEYLCQFCRGMNAFDEMKPLALNSPIAVPLTVAGQPLAPPSLPPGSHFRPPTFA